jgi:hypothetical protein
MNFEKIIRGWKNRSATLATAAVIIAIGAAAVLLAGRAEALPLSHAGAAALQHSAQETDVTLVRDGCGRGMRFSNSRGGCVQDFNGGPRVVVVPHGCGPGFRFSNSRQACVPMGRGGQVDEGAAAVAIGVGVLNALAGGNNQHRNNLHNNGGRRSGCGPGFRFSNSRGHCVPN